MHSQTVDCNDGRSPAITQDEKSDFALNLQPSAKVDMLLSHLICYGANIGANLINSLKHIYVRYLKIILFDAMIGDQNCIKCSKVLTL